MRSKEYAFLSIAELGALLRAGELSCVELAEYFLNRIQQFNPKLQAFITVSSDRALTAAKQADALLSKDKDLGSLHGIPYAVKDNLATAGVRTTANSQSLQDWIPNEDAAAVARLHEAGAVLLGKLSMNEYGFGDYPLCRISSNPWNCATHTGGSSSGSACAVAARMAVFTLGTDGGGSIRIPASICGLAGLAPSPGHIDGSGALPPTMFDRTARRVGPFTRGVGDLIEVLTILSDIRVVQVDAKELRIGRLRAHEEEIGSQPDVANSLEQAVNVLANEVGCRFFDVEIPRFSLALANNWKFLAFDAAKRYAHAVDEQPSFYSPGFKNLIERGKKTSKQEMEEAEAFRAEFEAALQDVFRRVDVLVMPTWPDLVTPPGESRLWQGPDALFTAPFNLVPCPALSIPCGFSRYRTPVGVQFVASRNNDGIILALARAFEAHTDWHTRIPSGYTDALPESTSNKLRE